MSKIKTLTKDFIKSLSAEKREPSWMLEKRLEALETLEALDRNPGFGPELTDLDLENLTYYLPPEAEPAASWDDVPEEIKQTFEELGIPESERAGLAGLGAQYDSEVVYQNLKSAFEKQGIIYTTMEAAARGDDLPDYLRKLVREKFLSCYKKNEHFYLALHTAVWSGGSFVYVPKDTKVEIPLNAYYRFNAKSAGQFEHTLIIADEGSELHFIEGCSAPRYNEANLHAGCVEIYVGRKAKVRYSTVENWSRNMYNLNTKRAVVEEGGRMEWVSGSFGSHIAMLYPTTILKGKNASADFLGVSLASEGQNLDTGANMIHEAENTSSKIVSKSISRNGGVNTFRSKVLIEKEAKNSKAYASCDSLILDDKSVSTAIPSLNVKNGSSDAAHEATVGRIGDEELEYLMSRGLSEDAALNLVVSGYVEQVSKELPLEYAVEMNNLVNLEMKGM